MPTPALVANELRCVKIAAVSALVTVIVLAASAADALPKIRLVATVRLAPPPATETDLQGNQRACLY